MNGDKNPAYPAALHIEALERPSRMLPTWRVVSATSGLTFPYPILIHESRKRSGRDSFSTPAVALFAWSRRECVVQVRSSLRSVVEVWFAMPRAVLGIRSY